MATIFTEQPIQIICGDNLAILKSMQDESVDLIYIDPPFFTGRMYEIIWNDGAEIRQFNDRWVTDKKSSDAKSTRASKDINVFLEWIEPRIREMHRILKKTGSFYLHCAWQSDAYLRVLCDKIFDRDPQNVIIWKRYGGVKNNATKKYSCQTDTILFYTKSNDFTFKMQYRELTDDQIKHEYKYKDEDGRKYALLRGGMYQKTGIAKKKYLDECKGSPITSLWDDEGLTINTSSSESLGYPTQKPESLLERIVKASSNDGDVLADFFCGCGTALAVAKKLKRKGIGVDVSPTACRLIAKRIGVSVDNIQGLPITTEEISELDGNEFQNWVIREFGGFSGKRGADGGVDGMLGPCPIQVKKYKAGRASLDAFSGTLLREGKTEGIFIALEYSSDFRTEVARLKRENDVIIHYFDISDVIEHRHYSIVDKFIPKHGLDKFYNVKWEGEK